MEAFGYKKLLKYGALAGAFAGPYGGLGGLGGFGGFRFGDFGGGYAAPYAYGGYGYPGYGFGYYG